MEETLWEIKVYVKGEVKKFTNSDYKETILEAEKKLGTMIR